MSICHHLPLGHRKLGILIFMIYKVKILYLTDAARLIFPQHKFILSLLHRSCMKMPMTSHNTITNKVKTYGNINQNK
jgi:hypothetical protein